MPHTFSETLLSLRHPGLGTEIVNWSLWRDTFEGGDQYREQYLEKFSDRETPAEFTTRKCLTPVPSFAKAAILDIRNSIFQRLGDISRVGGSDGYQRAVVGENGGVDRNGSSMNSFIGIDVLTELLLMGRVGLFVDAPSVVPTTLATEAQMPYLYTYPVEDILSWTFESPEQPGRFKAVLLRDHVLEFESEFGGVDLPMGHKTRFRLIWKSEETGKVHYKLFDENKELIFLNDSGDDGSVMLDIETVPFVMPSIGDSLMKDVAHHQRALLNLVSSDVYWAIKSNTPFLTIQEDLRTKGGHLKQTGEDATPGSQPAGENIEEIGSGKGRYYDLKTDRPDYIAPPSDPLIASMKLQEKLEDDIRKLVNLAVANKAGSRTESAEAKKLSSQGLEAGLSFIGMVLQQAERHVAWHWANYENVRQPKISKVSYPTRYVLKTDKERVEEADDLLELMDRIPGKGIKRSLAKLVVNTLLADKESADTIEAIISEIDSAGYVSSDHEFIFRAQEQGLVGDELASEALGFRKGEVDKAKDDKAERAAATLVAQTAISEQRAAARGVPDIDPNPDSGADEKQEAQDG